MRRYLFVLALLVMSIVPAVAQVQTGSVILLRGASGRYLSAVPPEDLVMSPNASAWEQWQYSNLSNVPALTSFHGTAFSAAFPSYAFSHVPQNVAAGTDITRDHLTGMTRVTSYTDSTGKTTWSSNSGPLNSNDQVVVWSAASGDGYYDLMRDTGDSRVGTYPGIRLSTFNVPADARWTVIVVPAPAADRKPPQTSAETGGLYQLRSYHGTYMQYDIGATMPTSALHAAKNSYRPRLSTLSSPDRPLVYGDKVALMWTSDPAQPDLAGDATNTNLIVRYAGLSPKMMWTLTDPTGTYRIGNRIPVGGKVCIRSDAGMTVSADPGMPNLKLSPNCSAWEWWTIERPN